MYNASDLQDLQALAARINNLSVKKKRWLAANSILRQLMTEPMLDQFQNVLHSKYNVPQEKIDQGMMTLWQNLEEESVVEFIEALTGHLVEGEDSTSADSLGGFNQTELNALESLVELVQRTT